jgi:hypothetical protein
MTGADFGPDLARNYGGLFQVDVTDHALAIFPYRNGCLAPDTDSQ